MLTPDPTAEFISTIFTGIIGFVFAILFSIFLGLLISPLFTFLWNSLMPTLFGFKEITWQQAVGLFLLARLLFGK